VHKKNIIFILIGAIIFSNSAYSCEFAEPIRCKQPSLDLDKGTFDLLKKRIKSFGQVWENNAGLKKKSSQFKCSKSKELDYQIKFIERFAKNNRNQYCEEHVKVLVIQAETLIDLSSSENKRVKNKRARLNLIDSAMDVSEALVYYKNKHPLR
jgi:hypothetical protein